jgi:TetR/AcrR family transcriptional regulator, regulator of cefoperazone and chloramphenicol sensitivity
MRNQEVKRLIIDTTKKLIREQTNVTIKDIADACFANIASVNYHFGTKDELMLVVIKEIVDEMKDELKQLFNDIENYPTLHDFYDDLILSIYRFARVNRTVIIHIFNDFTLQNELVTLFMLAHNKMNDFETELISKVVQNKLNPTDKKTYVKYLNFVSSIIVPIFFGVRDRNSGQFFKFDLENDEDLRKHYIDSLIRQIN